MHETFQIGPKLCHFWKNTFPVYFGDLECISILLKHLLLNVLSVLVADQSRESSASASLRCLPPAPSGKKVKTAGDDTFFICHSEKIVGMADGVGGWQMLELKLASMQGSSCHTINDYYLPEATRLCWSSTHYVMCTLKNEIPKFIHFMYSCTLIMYLAAKSSSNFHLPCCVINSLHAGQWAQGYAGNSEQRRCNCCTDGMFDNMHNNELTAVVVHSTQAGHESWPSWSAAQKIVALARE